ncbi:MAG: META domain-containing protein [Actinobacteria bacterium]|nr:META domain-containing protein [Actinomycetota bacterium]
MFRSSRRIAAVLVTAVLLGIVGGCSSETSSLAGTNWQLSEWTLSSLDPVDLTITAQFSDGEISGSGGVNSYSGPCRLGPGTAFSAGPLAATEIGGPKPAMRGEAAYFALLAQAKSYKTTAGKLSLYDSGGNVSLVFDQVDK